MAKLKIAVLISGRGSNLQALVDATSNDDYPAEIVLVISNIAEAGGLQLAKKAGILTAVVNRKAFASRELFEDALHEKIKASKAELVCLAGFMLILNDSFVRRWRNRLINIHPSLMPSFKGLHVHERAIEAGVRFSGCTVHFVRSAMDEGPIIAQACVAVHQDDSPDDLASRILRQEHRIYPMVVRMIAEGRVRVINELVTIDNVQNPANTLINPDI